MADNVQEITLHAPLPEEPGKLATMDSRPVEVQKFEFQQRAAKEAQVRDDMIRVAHRAGASIRQLADVSGLGRKTVTAIAAAHSASTATRGRQNATIRSIVNPQ